MVVMLLRLLLGCLMPLMSGLMVALFWIRSHVYPPPVLGSTLISRSIAGVRIMLIMFILIMWFSLVGGSLLFLGICRLFSELNGVILALHSSDAVHIGVDNLGVVRHVGRLLNGHRGSTPLELVTDGDLLVLIERMLHLRGHDTVRITKVKGHADEGMVLDGQVPQLDKVGNDAADEAADFGRRRVGHAVINARRKLSGVCGRWYPVILVLHRFFIAISRAVVNHDGNDGTAPGPMVWSAGALPKKRRLLHAVRDFAMLPGPPAIWDGEWVSVPASAISAEDVAHWPYTTGLLVKWVAFLGSLHWPVGGADLDGVSYVELLILFELWAGEFQCRLFRLVQVLIFGALVGLLVLR